MISGRSGGMSTLWRFSSAGHYLPLLPALIRPDVGRMTLLLAQIREDTGFPINVDTGCSSKNFEKAV